MAKLTACSHEKELFHPTTRQHIINDLLNFLSPKTYDFDAIAVSGYSSALVSPTIADMLGKNLVLIRKPEDKHHSGWQNEGIHGQRCIFIDDLIGGGTTVKRVLTGVDELGGTLVAVTMYNARHQTLATLRELDIYGVLMWQMPAKSRVHENDYRNVLNSY